MKVIELLNKIANGEEVPNKIRFDNTYWNRICGKKYVYYIDDNNDNDLFIYFFRKNLTFSLNDEVEIIEPQEHKIPEKLNLDTDVLRGREVIRSVDYLIEDKINEIIDYLEELKNE